MLEIIMEEYHFSTLWNGGIMIFCLFAAIVYLFILPASKNHPLWKTILFMVGLTAIFAAIGSPINIEGRMRLSTHILQLLLLLFIAPPLLVAGFKTEVLGFAKKVPWLEKGLQILNSPLLAVILFCLFFYGYHIPAVFNLARMDLYLNYFFMFGLFLSSVLLWVQIVKAGGKKKQHRNYAVLTMLLLLPFSLLLFVSGEGIYAVYSDVDFFISAMELCLPALDTLSEDFYIALLPFDPVYEQQLGGIMFLAGQVMLIGGWALLSEKLH